MSPIITMSGPRTKRQFAGAASDPAQRQITSFFTNSTTGTSSSPYSISNTTVPRSLSANDSSVQANLLSVGMRVRKAVPEGYKVAEYSAFSLWDENSDAMQTGGSGDVGRSRANAVSAPRELLPFCGIHRVGGLGTQSTAASYPVEPIFGSSSTSTTAPYPSLFSINNADSMDDCPGLTLSQESTDSNTSTNSGITGAKTRKRFFVDDEDETPGITGRQSFLSWQDDEVSPRSLAPAGWGNGRAIAVPRKGRQRSKPTVSDALGQENVMVMDEDFEEAPFLDRNLEVEMDDV